MSYLNFKIPPFHLLNDKPAPETNTGLRQPRGDQRVIIYYNQDVFATTVWGFWTSWR
jgi:hypothetical protein